MGHGPKSTEHFSTFPRTQTPVHFVPEIVSVFRTHSAQIGTAELAKGLSSDAVMATLRDGLCKLGFEIEMGKSTASKLKRPVFFGQDGRPSRQYEIDGFHSAWRCGIEIEAGRAWMGNAVYRDLVQAMVMVDLEHLVLAVPMTYKYLSGGRPTVSKDLRVARRMSFAIHSDEDSWRSDFCLISTP
jgi:hypothetical protein